MSQYDPYQPPEEAPNPYAPPEADLTAAPHHMPTLSTGEFSVSEVIGRAWELYKARFGVVFGVCVIALAVNYAFQFATSFAVQAIGPDSPAGALTQIGMTIVGVAIQLWLTAGQSYTLLKVAKGMDAQVGDLFQGGPWVLRIIGASILFGLVIFGVVAAVAIPAALVALAVGADATGIRIGVFVLAGLAIFVAILILMARLYQYIYLIIDREAGAVESLQLSSQITKGHVGELIGLSIVAGFISLAGVLACGVGILFTIPLGALIYACTYVALVGADPGKPVKLEPLGEPDFV